MDSTQGVCILMGKIKFCCVCVCVSVCNIHINLVKKKAKVVIRPLQTFIGSIILKAENLLNAFLMSLPRKFCV